MNYQTRNTMKVTAITRYKHGALWTAIKQLGWTQKEMANQCGVCQNRFNSIINMHVRPTEKEANNIQRVLGQHDIYLDPTQEWPSAFTGYKKSLVVEQTKDVGPLALNFAETYYAQLEDGSSPSDELVEEEKRDALQKALDCLTKRERTVVDYRFGFTGGSKHTQKECADHFKVSKSLIDLVVKRSIAKMRIAMERMDRWSELSLINAEDIQEVCAPSERWNTRVGSKIK